MPTALLLMVALIFWAVTPSALNVDERQLVGLWGLDHEAATTELRADRTWYADGEYAGRWRVRDGVLRVAPAGRTVAERVQALFAADHPSQLSRLAWDGPDRVRLYAHSSAAPQSVQPIAYLTLTRLTPHPSRD